MSKPLKKRMTRKAAERIGKAYEDKSPSDKTKKDGFPKRAIDAAVKNDKPE